MAYGFVLDTLGRLVERSLVVVDPGRTTRYRMLETLREYAAERLEARHDERHARQASRAVLQPVRAGSRDGTARSRPTPGVSRACGRSNPTSEPRWLGSAHPAATSTPPSPWPAPWACSGTWAATSRAARPSPGCSHREPAATGARARALQAVSIVERPRACLVHPSRGAPNGRTKSRPVRGARRRPPRSVVPGAARRRRASPAPSLNAVNSSCSRRKASSTPITTRGGGGDRLRPHGQALKAGRQDLAIPTGRAAAAAFRELDDPWGLSAILYHLGWGLRQFGRYPEAARTLEEAIDVAAGAGLYNTVQWALADLA